VCEKERKFLVEACDRGLASMGAELLMFSRAANVDSAKQSPRLRRQGICVFDTEEEASIGRVCASGPAIPTAKPE